MEQGEYYIKGVRYYRIGYACEGIDGGGCAARFEAERHTMRATWLVAPYSHSWGAKARKVTVILCDDCSQRHDRNRSRIGGTADMVPID